jgi:hypothetical protein
MSKEATFLHPYLLSESGAVTPSRDAFFRTRNFPNGRRKRRGIPFWDFRKNKTCLIWARIPTPAHFFVVCAAVLRGQSKVHFPHLQREQVSLLSKNKFCDSLTLEHCCGGEGGMRNQFPYHIKIPLSL